VPANVYDVDIAAIGQAGGAGGDAQGVFGTSHGGGVGGNPAEVRAQYVAVTPGEVLYYGIASPTVPGGSGGYSVRGGSPPS
jgi:hypothetical protein